LIFPLHEGALVAVLGKVGIGAAGQDVSPCGFEVGTRFLEGRRNTISAGAATREREEPAEPSPLLDILRHTRALADPSDFDVAIENSSTLAVAVLIAAAGEGGHGP
jgi:hypothetical protein